MRRTLLLLALVSIGGCRSLTAPDPALDRRAGATMAEPLPTHWPIALEHHLTLKGDRYVFEARLDSPHYPMPGHQKTEGEHTVGWTVKLGMRSSFLILQRVTYRGEPFVLQYFTPDNEVVYREVEFRMYGSHIQITFPAEWTVGFPLDGSYGFVFEYLDGFYDGGGHIGPGPAYTGVIGDHNNREPLPADEPVAVEWGMR